MNFKHSLGIQWMRLSKQIGWIFALLGIFVFIAAGCAGFGKRLSPPRIHLSNIELQGIQGMESVMRVDLRVFNTNDVPIVIKGLDCELGIGGKPLASGISNSEVSIPAYETAVLPVTVYSSVLDIFKGLLDLGNMKDLKYQIKGKVRLDAGPLAPTVIPFKSEGDLPFERIRG